MTTDPNGAEYAQKVAAGYTFDSATLDLGALVQDADATESAQVRIPLAMMNRHGLIAGATGTGKTRTLQLMAEGLSTAGVPVFVADIKGDLTGMAVDGEPKDFIAKRAVDIGQDWSPASFPLEFYSLGGIGQGVPIRTTVTDFGPLLMSKVLGLNDTQESSLALIFHWADTNKLALLDLKDLRAVIQFLTSKEGKEQLAGIGGVSPASAGVILREISALEAQGAGSSSASPHSTRRICSPSAPTAGAPSQPSSCPRCRTAPRCSAPSSCGCSPTSSPTSPRWATSTSPSWSSSSTRRTCSSPTRPRTSSPR